MKSKIDSDLLDEIIKQFYEKNPQQISWSFDCQSIPGVTLYIDPPGTYGTKDPNGVVFSSLNLERLVECAMNQYLNLRTKVMYEYSTNKGIITICQKPNNKN